jgi:Cu2+-exporting ATPase
MQPIACYHCGLPVVDPLRWTVVIQQESQPMCCPGCQAVASAIVNGGFDQYYQFRTQTAPTAQQTDFDQRQIEQEFLFCDDEQLQQAFVLTTPDHQREIRLGIDQIHCAACCWLIENALRQLPGVSFIAVNLGSHRATLRWIPEQIKLSGILKQLQRLGYHAHPFNHSTQQQLKDQSRRRQWLQLGVAAMVMMQSGMFSFAIYSGEFTGMANDHKRLLEILGLIMTAPVMFYSATPFFFGAWRSLRFGQVGMDVPVSLALCVAFMASCFTALTGKGEVYFDSISMFVFLLLLARFAESSARQHFFSAEVSSLLPLMCRVASVSTHRLPSSENNTSTTIWMEKKLTDVALFDQVQVRAGEVVPFDGKITDGHSSVDESAFSGESLPIIKTIGDPIYAASINGEGLLTLEVRQPLGQARVDVISHLAERNQAQKPAIALLSHQVAQYFSVFVILLASISASYWAYAANWQQAIAIAVAVLVVSCPCALSLAIPAALTFCYQALRQQGLWMLDSQIIARMQTIDQVVLDKTGTLTTGSFQLLATQTTPHANALQYTTTQLNEIAAALESVSGHPMASAFRAIATDWPIHAVSIHTGMGVEGQIKDQWYRIGNRKFCSQWCAIDPPEAIITPLTASTTQPIYLVRPDGLLAIFQVQDALREDAAHLVNTLQQKGMSVRMLSGDSSGAAEQIAQQLGITDVRSGLTPEQKLAHILALQQQGLKVMMVGDGINDIPVLAQADVSIAMNTASDLAKVQANAILLRNQLSPLLALFKHCRQTQRIIHQNLFWALLYNGLSLPAAALGWVPPWVAAIGMSLSSLIVTLNSVRLRKIR